MPDKIDFGDAPAPDARGHIRLAAVTPAPPGPPRRRRPRPRSR